MFIAFNLDKLSILWLQRVGQWNMYVWFFAALAVFTIVYHSACVSLAWSQMSSTLLYLHERNFEIISILFWLVSLYRTFWYWNVHEDCCRSYDNIFAGDDHLYSLFGRLWFQHEFKVREINFYLRVLCFFPRGAQPDSAYSLHFSNNYVGSLEIHRRLPSKQEKHCHEANDSGDYFIISHQPHHLNSYLHVSQHQWVEYHSGFQRDDKRYFAWKWSQLDHLQGRDFRSCS